MDREVVARRLREARQSLVTPQREVVADALVGQPETVPVECRGDVGDIASTEVEREMDQSLVELFTAELSELDDANDRLAAGTNGKCELCGDPIPDQRLATVPWARMCLEHQREREQTRTGCKETS